MLYRRSIDRVKGIDICKPHELCFNWLLLMNIFLRWIDLSKVQKQNFKTLSGDKIIYNIKPRKISSDLTLSYNFYFNELKKTYLRHLHLNESIVVRLNKIERAKV